MLGQTLSGMIHDSQVPWLEKRIICFKRINHLAEEDEHLDDEYVGSTEPLVEHIKIMRLC